MTQARELVPVEVVGGVRRAAHSALNEVGRDVLERRVVVADEVEVHDFLALHEQRRRDRVDGRVAPPLVEEAAELVKVLEVRRVLLAAPEVGVGNLQVRPEVAAVVGPALVLGDEPAEVVGRHVLLVGLQPLERGLPKSRDRFLELVQRQREAVPEAVLAHVPEHVKSEVAEALRVGLDAPVVLVRLHQLVVIEEPGLEAAHVAVGLAAAVDDAFVLELAHLLVGQVLVDPGRDRPLRRGDHAELCLATHELRDDVHELLAELLVVQEDPVVVEILVEPVLVAHNRAGNRAEVLVPAQCNKCRILALVQQRVRAAVRRVRDRRGLMDPCEKEESVDDKDHEQDPQSPYAHCDVCHTSFEFCLLCGFSLVWVKLEWK